MRRTATGEARLGYAAAAVAPQSSGGGRARRPDSSCCTCPASPGGPAGRSAPGARPAAGAPRPRGRRRAPPRGREPLRTAPAAAAWARRCTGPRRSGPETPALGAAGSGEQGGVGRKCAASSGSRKAERRRRGACLEGSGGCREGAAVLQLLPHLRQDVVLPDREGAGTSTVGRSPSAVPHATISSPPAIVEQRLQYRRPLCELLPPFSRQAERRGLFLSHPAAMQGR